ncbi:hypothetical protein [Bacillus salipaludis]
MFIEYLIGICSERQLDKEIKMNIVCLWFSGLNSIIRFHIIVGTMNP